MLISCTALKEIIPEEEKNKTFITSGPNTFHQWKDWENIGWCVVPRNKDMIIKLQH